MKKLATIFGLLMMMVLVTSFTSSNEIGRKGVSGGQETREPSFNLSSVSYDIGRKGVSGGQETRVPSFNFSSASYDIGRKGVSGGQETRVPSYN